MKLGKIITTIIDKLSLGLSAIAGIAIVVMMLTMLSDGVARKIFGSLPGAFETSKVLMVVIAFLPQAYTQLNRRHVSIDLFLNRIPPKRAYIFNAIGALLGAGFFGLLTWLTWREAWHSTVIREFWMAEINYPIWPFRWMLPIGIGLLAIQFLRTGIEEIERIFQGR